MTAKKYIARRIHLVLLCGLMAGGYSNLCAQTQNAAGEARKTDVPGLEIRKLRAKWVDPQAETTDTNKIRRYESMLREGRRLLREYPQAQNAYMVRALMLQGTRGLLVLGAGQIDREQVIDLAEKIVISEAPPAWRLEADVLLTQLSLVQSDGEEDKSVREKIEDFISRYEESSVTPDALMQAAKMADQHGLARFHRGVLDRLEADFVSREGVGGFLYRSGRRVRATGRSLSAMLPRADKTKLILPIDAMGTSTLVLFWDPSNWRSKELFQDMATYFAGNPVDGSGAISIALGNDVDSLKQASDSLDVDFPMGYLAQASEHPLLETYAVRQVPMFYLLGADGRIYENPQEHLGISWKEARNGVEHHARRYWLRRDRVNSARAGLFLVDALAKEAGPGVADFCNEILRARLHLTLEARAEVFGDIAARLMRWKDIPAPGEKLRREVLSWMLLRYVDIQAGRNRISDELRARAKGLESPSDAPVAALAAEGIKALVAAHDSSRPAGVVEAFLGRYETTDLEWAAEILATFIALETGQDGICYRLLAQLQQRDDNPRCMGLLREGFDMVPWAFKARPIRLELKDLEGKSISLPEDLDSSAYLVHFWSADAPIGSQGDYSGLKNADSLYTKREMPEGVRIVSVYVGKDLQVARDQAARHPEWFHTHLPGGWNSQALRALDITRLPSAWLIGNGGAVILDNMAFSLERELPETGKSVSILYHGVRKEDMDDLFTLVYRLDRYMQARQAARALWGKSYQEIMGMNQDHFKRSLVSVLDYGPKQILVKINQRTEEEIIAALDPLPEDVKTLPEDVRKKILGSLDRLARAGERIDHLEEITRRERWKYIRDRHEIDFSQARERLWLLEIHWRDFARRDLPTHLLDGLFERIISKGTTRRKWDMKPSSRKTDNRE